jgi:hypothetical protein
MDMPERCLSRRLQETLLAFSSLISSLLARCFLDGRRHCCVDDLSLSARWSLSNGEEEENRP